MIAYAEYDSNNNHRIYLVDMNGNNKKLIAQNTNYGQPIFSNNGKYIVHLNNDRITISDVSGNEISRLTNDTLRSTRMYPGYDISNEKVVFSLQGNITIVDMDGSNRMTITAGYHPIFSHDGNKILFEKNLGSPFVPEWDDEEMWYNQSLRIINIDGSNEIELGQCNYLYYILNKQFYSNDRQIYFTVEKRIHPIERRSNSNSQGLDNGIWVVDSVGNNLTKLKNKATSFAFFHPRKRRRT